MRWVWRGSAAAAVVIGWGFIFFHNNMHITPSVVFIGLGYMAGIAGIYTLFKTGAAAVSSTDDDDDTSDAAWGLMVGARDELEREKRTLLKAIKEAEFDHQMGKLSKRDVDEMIRNYRLRAIEVIKLLEDSGKPGTPREQIQREVRARLEVEAVRSKIERAHADLGQRRNQKKAAAAAQKAARNAAALGVPGHVAAAMAQAAARQTDDDADDELPAAKADAAKADEAKPDGAKTEAKTDDAKTETKADVAKADVKAEAADAKTEATAAEATADAKPEAKTEAAKADVKSDVKTDAKAAEAKTGTEAKSDAKASNGVTAEDKPESTSTREADTKEATP
jgi:ribonuclease E